MASEVTLSKQELYDLALSFVPTSGAISYADLRAKIIESGQPNALPMIQELKKRKVIAARVEVIDGVINHTYSRSTG